MTAASRRGEARRSGTAARPKLRGGPVGGTRGAPHQ